MGDVLVLAGQLCMFCTALFGVLVSEHFRALSGEKRPFWWGYKSSWCFMTWQMEGQVSQFLQNRLSFPSGLVTISYGCNAIYIIYVYINIKKYTSRCWIV